MKRALTFFAAALVFAPSAFADDPVYKSPVDLAVTPDGSDLLVVCAESGTLQVLALPGGTLRAEIAVDADPTAVALAPDGRTAYVTSRFADAVDVVDLEQLAVVDKLPAGWAPMDVAVDAAGERLFVANAISRDVSVIDLATGTERKRLRAGEWPWDLALAPGRLYVANLLSRPHPPEEPPVPELTVIDTESERVVDRLPLPGANLIYDVAADGEGRVILPLIRPKNLVPLIHVAGGWTITNGVGYLNGRGPSQILVDTMNHHYADPTAVAFGGGRAYVAAGGSDRLLILDRKALEDTADEGGEHLAERLDLAPRFVTAEVATGPYPVALAVDPIRGHVYVANRLGDSVTVVDPDKAQAVATFHLGGPADETPERRGERFFYSGEAVFAGQFSCASCHPEGRHDGLVYDISPDGLGRNLVDTRTLLGVRGTAPFKWSGLNPDLHTQCGPRAAKFIMRSPGFQPDELDDVVAYMAALPLPKNRHTRERLTPIQEWGKRIFERAVDNTGQTIVGANRCNFCHPGPRFTNNRAFDVGTVAEHDDSGLIDTPTLNGLVETAPFLHDGRALTLEELWTVYNPDDRHGRANDLGKDELNALVEYLKTL